MTQQRSIWKRIFYLSITRIIIGLIACVTIASIGQSSIKKLLEFVSFSDEIKNLIGGIIITAVTLIVYTILYKIYEKRKISELSIRGLFKNLLLGILLGSLLQSLTIYVMFISKGYSIQSVNSLIYILPSLSAAFTSAIFEEILFRGIIFRITEENLGSYYALLISAIIFGAMHFANPHSSISMAISIAIQAGLLLGAAFIYSKNLWFPIALHFAWNFTQSGIYGAATSGNAVSKSLFTAKIEGSNLITGGSFGPEGSIQAPLFCLIATIILIVLCIKQGKLIKPKWTNIPSTQIE